MLQSKIISWIKAHRVEALLLAAILMLGAFLRLYRIDEYMTFLGDEGRDAIIVRNIFVNLHPPLIGPGTSIGNMYLGPLYYYLSAPFSLLFGFSPVGASVMVALFGISTIFLIWWTAREWFGNIAGLIASFFYAISPVVIIYNRSSWNPNVMPFFSLLCIYATWRVWSPSAQASEGQANPKRWRWLVILGGSFAFVMQTHYLGLILLPVIFLFILLAYLTITNNKWFHGFMARWFSWKVHNHVTMQQLSHVKVQENKKGFWKYALIGFALFLFLMSPLVIFDYRHGWNNFGAIKTFFTVRQDTVSAKPWGAIPKLFPLWQEIVTRLFGGTNVTAGRWAAFGLLDGTVALFVMKWWHKKKIPHAYFLLVTWIVVSLLGLGAYKHELYDHYYGFLFAAPFLLMGGITQDVIDTFKKRGIVAKSIAFSLVPLSLIPLAAVNFANSPLQYPPNRQLQRSVAVAKKIEEEAGRKKLNLAVIAERNYEGAYQYFLEKDKTGFIKIDPLNTANTIADQLFVVCELPKEKCDPTHNPKAEVANYGWSKIESEWNIEGITLYKLVHTEQ